MKLPILFLLLNGLDLLGTYCLCSGPWPVAHEGNPLAAWVIAHLGWGGLAAGKAVDSLVVLGVLAWVRKRSSRHATGGLLLGCLLLAIACGYSVSLLILCGD